MTCRGWNPHIALYVEGDLEPDVLRQLEQHLAGCADCQALADALRESQAVVREIRGDVIETSALNRVRANVLERVRQIEARRTWLDRAGIWLWGGFRLRYALGLGVIVFCAIGVWRFTQPITETTALLEVPAVSKPPVVEAAEPVERQVEPSAVPAPPAVVTATRTKPSEPVAVAREADINPAPMPVEPSIDPATTTSDTVVQILTDDPNIVIYWLIEQTGGQ